MPGGRLIRLPHFTFPHLAGSGVALWRARAAGKFQIAIPGVFRRRASAHARSRASCSIRGETPVFTSGFCEENISLSALFKYAVNAL